MDHIGNITKKISFSKIFSVILLVFAIAFNLWLYRLEPTAAIDPNDNTFQYALVDRTNQIWDFAANNCPKNLSFVICHLSFLVDHWVPNWAQGYNLPTYYSHIPQIIIVASYRFLTMFSEFQISNFKFQIDLFQYYHLIIYLLLSFFPLSVFLALRVIRLPWLIAGFGALMTSHISTDGLYGLDPASFLWRGYGLSSQLFAMIPLPLAIACSWRYFNEKKSSFVLPVFFLVATTSGHLGVGIIALLSLIPMALAKPSIENFKKLFLLGGVTVGILSYWIVPVLLYDNYHNISVWDPPWKFNSYGAKEVMTRLFNGDLFDFGRLPILTLMIFVGLFSQTNFTYLFLFFLLLYFGRTTWGGLIDLIPGMKEFHLSRFIVGLHASGIFLVAIGFNWILEKVLRKHNLLIGLFAYLFIGLLILVPVYQQTIRYNELNDKLIIQANENFDKAKKDLDELFTSLRNLPPGRVFAGRGGDFGKNFRVAETPYNIYLSTFGIPTVLWLPQTWSPNSDVEQYFSDDNIATYHLFGVRYVAAPPSAAARPFWHLVKEAASWKLYEIPTTAYITAGVRPAVVSVDKRSYANVVRLWVQSDKTHQLGLYPELTFAKDYPRKTGLPNFRMLDEVTYKTPEGNLHNLFKEPPVYLPPGITNVTTFNNLTIQQFNNAKILSQNQESDMVFRAKVNVGKNCTECIVILKQTFHPTWRAAVDGQPVKPFSVFPVFLAVSVPEGDHEVSFVYQPSTLKVSLLFFALLVIFVLLVGKKFYLGY